MTGRDDKIALLRAKTERLKHWRFEVTDDETNQMLAEGDGPTFADAILALPEPIMYPAQFRIRWFPQRDAEALPVPARLAASPSSGPAGDGTG